DEFGGLAAGDVVAGQEAGGAGSAGWATGIAADYPVGVGALDKEPEGVAVGHVGEGLLIRGDRIRIVGGVADELGDLAAGDRVARLEAGGFARRAGWGGAIAADDAPAGQAADIGIERAAHCDITVLDRAGGRRGAGGFRVG